MNIEGHSTSPSTSVNITLPGLPHDIFLLVLDGLAAQDVSNCQKVSRRWREVFSKEEYLKVMLKRYPLAREVRELSERGILCSSAPASGIDWASIFRTVAGRYVHLSRGKASSVVTHKLAASEQVGHWFPVGQWDYHESQSGGRLYYENVATHLSRLGAKPYLFRFTLWSYDDGWLVYAPGSDSHSLDAAEGQMLALLDVDSNATYPIPFSRSSKIIRNLRLKDKTIIIEWAEKDPFHDLIESEKVHRHFATCFDIELLPTGLNTRTARVVFRSEWKIHFLGLPLNQRDRFFSTHNASHYAVYFWQPNRGMYTGDEEMPIESLFVWDISAASAYCPSTDPAGKHRPPNDDGPHVLSRFSFHALDFLGIRQHSNISLSSLHLDSASSSLTVRQNVCVAGQGYFDPAERLFNARTTSFPFSGLGPCLQRDWDGNLPPYRGHCTMESADVEAAEKWFTPIMDIVDTAADVRVSLVETCFTGLLVQNKMVVRIKALGVWSTLDDRLASQVTGMGRINGDERWVVGQNDKMEIVVVKF